MREYVTFGWSSSSSTMATSSWSPVAMLVVFYCVNHDKQVSIYYFIALQNLTSKY